MTARQIFEATLIELSKVQAPALKLYEFNYLFNKAINQYINKVYNVYDINQQTTDDLRVLKSTAFLTPKKVQLGTNNSAVHNPKSNNMTIGEIKTTLEDGSTKVVKTEKFDNGYKVTTTITKDGKSTSNYVIYGSYDGQATSYLSKSHSSIQSLHGATYEVEMPLDYLHMLNCVCIYYVAKQKDCWDAGSYIEVPATRLTADSWSQIVTDIYNRPSPMRPYYYIHNLNQRNTLPTDPVVVTTNGSVETGTDMNGIYKVTSSEGEDGDKSNFPRTFKLEGVDNKQSLVEKPTAARIGNASTVRCEIRYGKIE